MFKHSRIATPDLVNPLSAGFAPRHRENVTTINGIDILNLGTVCQLVNPDGEDVEMITIEHLAPLKFHYAAQPVGYDGSLFYLVEDSGNDTSEGVPMVILRGYGL